ncbi:hypothetical protein ABSA28_01171 [Candidatus Hepatincolaceae symbiont of Richtersius coronifer]
MDISLIRIIIPLVIILISWYVWSLKKKFVTKQEFDEYKEAQGKIVHSFDRGISEIKITISHMEKSLSRIEDHILNYKKK